MIEITGHGLSIHDLITISRERTRILLSKKAVKQINNSYKNLLDLAQEGKAFYGINTGYGIFADKHITNEENKLLNRNLIFSHAVATGDPLQEDIVRAAMAVRVNTLAKGFSGVCINVVTTLIDMLNKDVIPVVSSKGSLGSSGDLCLLAQIGLVMMRDGKNDDNNTGQVIQGRKIISGKKAMAQAGIERIELSNKDGLALINGATFSAALTALCVGDMQDLFSIANSAHALTLEALCGRSDAFMHSIHEARGIEGQIESAKMIRNLIEDSSFVDCLNQVQDAYSLRCAPQVHGAVRETEKFAGDIITKEINAATDNPLVVDRNKIVSGGNFHGEPIGMVADYLSIAAAELGAISERRIFRMMDKNLNNGLPAMLVDPETREGVNSGIMILQYTAAALALENQTLASPDSIKSLPTSANQEDHNANAFNAAIHLRQIIQNTTKILAIELYTAARGIDLRRRINPESDLGNGTGKIYNLIRKHFEYHADDIQWRLDIEPFYEMLINRSKFKEEILSIVN